VISKDRPSNRRIQHLMLEAIYSDIVDSSVRSSFMSGSSDHGQGPSFKAIARIRSVCVGNSWAMLQLCCVDILCTGECETKSLGHRTAGMIQR
jgi:hypothetical protein